MSDLEGQDRAAPSRPRPWWVGGAVVALGCFWLYGAAQLPQTALYATVGPGMFVTIIGAALVALGLTLLVQIAQGERFEPVGTEDAAADASVSTGALLTAVLAAALPLYALQRFGFVPTAAIMFALMARALRSRRPLLDLSIGAVIGLVSWYGFSALGVPIGDLARLPPWSELAAF